MPRVPRTDDADRADLRNGGDAPIAERAHWSRLRRVLVQREVRARIRVVRQVGFQDRLQPGGVEHDDVIEAFAADGADESFDVGVLPWRTRRGAHVLNTHRFRGGDEALKRQIAVVDHIPRRLIPLKGFAELLRGPGGGGVTRHRDMHDPATFVCEDDEHEQQPLRGGWDDEEIGGRDLLDVIGQEGAPRLGRWGGRSPHILRHRRLGDLHPDLEELAVDPWRAPQII
jgi:hypothetical protein